MERFHSSLIISVCSIVRHCFLVVGSYFLLRKERAVVVLTVPLTLILFVIRSQFLGVSLQSEDLL